LTALLVACSQVFSLYVLDAEVWGGAGARLCESIRECDPRAPRMTPEAGATRYILKPDLVGLVEAAHDIASVAASSPERTSLARQ
jgi:hypothetical protein